MKAPPCCLLSCHSRISDLFQKDCHLLPQFHHKGPGQPISGRFHWKEWNADWTEVPELNEVRPASTCQLDGSHLGELLLKKIKKSKQFNNIYKLGCTGWRYLMRWPERSIVAYKLLGLTLCKRLTASFFNRANSYRMWWVCTFSSSMDSLKRATSEASCDVPLQLVRSSINI